MAIDLNTQGAPPADIRTRGKSDPNAVKAAEALVNGTVEWIACTGAESLSGKEKTESARKEAASVVKALDKMGWTSHTSYSKVAKAVIVTLGENTPKEADDDNEVTDDGDGEADEATESGNRRRSRAA